MTINRPSSGFGTWCPPCQDWAFAIDPSIEGRGVRLDAYVKGEGRAFIEMQAQTEYYLGCRLRYYQSVIDSDLLHKGDDYEDLPRSYIIFLCVHDSFGCGLPVYTIEPRCLENNDCQLDTRCTWIVLNGSAWVKEDDEKLRSLLQYIEDGTVTEAMILWPKLTVWL